MHTAEDKKNLNAKGNLDALVREYAVSGLVEGELAAKSGAK